MSSLVLLLIVALAVYALLGRWSWSERAHVGLSSGTIETTMILRGAHQLCARVDMVWSADRIN